MPKKTTKRVTKGLADAIQSVVDRKRAFAAHAFKPADQSIEAPKDVLLAACQVIAERFEPLQFKYLKSDRGLVRKRGDWVDRLSFGTDHYNVRGERVDLTVSALACNNRIKRMRNNGESVFPFNLEWGSIAGGDLGRLVADSTFFHWNLADPKQRAATIDDVVEHIKNIALPWFAKFEDYETFSQAAESDDIRCFEIHNEIDLRLLYEGQQSAARCIERWCQHHADQVPSILNNLELIKQTPPAGVPSGWPRKIAVAVWRYRLNVDFSRIQETL